MQRFSIGSRLLRRWMLLVAVRSSARRARSRPSPTWTSTPNRSAPTPSTLPWAYDTTTTQPAVFVNVSAQGDSDSIGCRIKIDDVVKDERSVEHPERLHLLPGQVRMSTHQAERQSTTDRFRT